ncbi:O-antigen ligase family protein [Paracoccaceae bacterium]|nr:O-antigen ligase family protein [Paracoccaceae bacterium]
MLPIPIIGMLLIFHNRTKFKLSSKSVSKFSQVSVLFALLIYTTTKIFIGIDQEMEGFELGAVSLFSGNPIPFSFCMLGISIFCLANWRRSNKKNKIIAFLLFLLGAFFSGYLSGARGTLLAILTILPIVLFYLTNSFKLSILIFLLSALFFLLLIHSKVINLSDNSYFSHVIDGLETILLSKNSDSSTILRIKMWSAAIQAISDSPIFGYGITERFSALKPHIDGSSFEYTHPHNDTLAGLIASGIAGGITAVISIISAFLAALVAPQRSPEKVLLGLMLSLVTLITASLSTVFFNDISSAWLAFSTYLIWTTDFKGDTANQLKQKHLIHQKVI